MTTVARGPRWDYRDPVWFPAYQDEQRIAPRRWILERPYGYEWTRGGITRRLIVPTGFVYDGASVPRLASAFVRPWILHKAACPHDWLYHWRGGLPVGSNLVKVGPDNWLDVLDHPDGRLRWSRKDGDRLFGRQLREDPDGPSRWERRAAYRAVRVGGYWAWRRKEAVAS